VRSAGVRALIIPRCGHSRGEGRKVARNHGAAGVDGQSIERFAAQADRYLSELQHSLEDGSYQPHPVKRVEIPKGDG
jgi:RNA-directed DNA polymerase